VLGLVFVVVNIFLFRQPNDPGEVNDRQQFINQSSSARPLNRELIAALANLAARNNDDQIRNLLASHGITFTVNQPTSTAPATSGAPASAGRTKAPR
jgi:hypothetical protein